MSSELGYYANNNWSSFYFAKEKIMNNIITISREFGSGGRELAKRLAEHLGYKYYDKAIIAEMAKQSGFNEDYIEGINKISNDDFPYTISRSFSLYSLHQKQATEVLVLEQKVIKELAKGGNCVFVGRSADVLLSDYEPFNIFVYADKKSKLSRCKQKAPADENLNDKQLEKKIKEIDKSRKKHSLLLGADSWGQKEAYNLCVNTTGMEIKNLVSAVANFAKTYFLEKK